MATAVIEQELLNTDEVAAMVGLRPNTLAIWRMTGKHLPFVTVGTRSVRYRRADVLEFIRRRTSGALEA